MRLLFLCLAAGEIGLAVFCYYRQTTYSSSTYIWMGVIYAVLPLLLTYIEPEENLPFQESVVKKLSESNISYQEIRYSGDYAAFAFCQDTKKLIALTPDAQDQTLLSLRTIPLSSVSKITFGETLGSWNLQINDDPPYQLKQPRLITKAMAHWEEFFLKAGVAATFTYEANTDYWISRFLGVTIFVPAVLLFFL